MRCIFRSVAILPLAGLIHLTWEIGRKTLDLSGESMIGLANRAATQVLAREV